MPDSCPPPLPFLPPRPVMDSPVERSSRGREKIIIRKKEALMSALLNIDSSSRAVRARDPSCAWHPETRERIPKKGSEKSPSGWTAKQPGKCVFTCVYVHPYVHPVCRTELADLAKSISGSNKQLSCVRGWDANASACYSGSETLHVMMTLPSSRRAQMRKVTRRWMQDVGCWLSRLLRDHVFPACCIH